MREAKLQATCKLMPQGLTKLLTINKLQKSSAHPRKRIS